MTESDQDEELERDLDRALAEARRLDLTLRNGVARAIAHRTEIQLLLERAADDAARARADAVGALRREAAATDAGETARWRREAETAALRLAPAESLVEGLRGQYAGAVEAVERARAQVDEHAARVRAVSARRTELLGQLAAARAYDELARTLEDVDKPLDTGGPTLEDLDERIRERIALTAARAEVDAGGPEDILRELETSSAARQAQSRLDELRRESGLTP